MDIEQMQVKFEAYLLTERHVTANTFASYQRDVIQFINYLRKISIDIQQVNDDTVKQYIHYLYGLKLAARSIARKISALKAFFSYISMHFAIKNSTQDVHIPKIEKRLPTYLTQEEVKNVMIHAEKDTTDLARRNAMILCLLYASGMRVSELIHIKITDIHFDTGFISIQGKGGRMRMIPLPQSILELLARYIKIYITGSELALIRNSLYLFPIIYGKQVKPISRQSCWGILKKMCEDAGIKRAISPHQLRHSFATHMLEKGADLRSLQILLGHEEITTVEVYTHVEISQLRTIYDKKHPRS